MYPSDRFLSRIAKLQKSHRTQPADRQIEVIRSAFVDSIRHMPPRFVESLFDELGSTLLEGDAGPFGHARFLGDVVDVIHESYDDENDPLDSSFWAVVGAVVDDFALELDMEFVTYVMKRALDHHAL